MKIPITLKRYSRLVDRSVNITVNSNLEVSSDQIAELDSHVEAQGWLLLEEEPTELPRPEPKSTGLTKSQELRREIELNYEAAGGEGAGLYTKEEYYEAMMTKYIEHARSKRIDKQAE